VAAAQDVGRLLERRLDADLVAGAHQDVGQAVGGEQIHGRRRWDEHQIVHVEAERLALVLHEPDDAKLAVRDLDRLAERVLVAEQLADHGAAEHDVAAVRLDILLGEEAPLIDAHLADLVEARADPDDEGVAPAAQVADGAAAVDHAADTVERHAAVAQRQLVLARQLVDGADGRCAEALGLAPPRRHLQKVTAHAGEGLGQVLAGALAKRHQQDDAEHADDDAERGQHRPQLVGTQRIKRGKKQLEERHTTWIYPDDDIENAAQSRGG